MGLGKVTVVAGLTLKNTEGERVKDWTSGPRPVAALMLARISALSRLRSSSSSMIPTFTQH